MDVTTFRHCPFCGAAKLTPLAGAKRAVACQSCGRELFSAPHAAVSAVIVDEREQQVLLTRRARPPHQGAWDLPGGFLELGESLEEGLAREIREELAISLRVRRFLGSYPDTYGPERTPVIAVFFVATIAAGEPAPGSDVASCTWFARDHVPRDLAFANCRRAIDDWLKQ